MTRKKAKAIAYYFIDEIVYVQPIDRMLLRQKHLLRYLDTFKSLNENKICQDIWKTGVSIYKHRAKKIDNMMTRCEKVRERYIASRND